MTDMADAALQPLSSLARLYGISTAYHDASGRQRRASPEALLAIMRSLGAAVEQPADVSGALRERRLQIWQRPLEPVIVVWDKALAVIDLRLPKALSDAPFDFGLQLESGEVITGRLNLAGSKAHSSVSIEGREYVRKRVALSEALPLGYHRLTIACRGLGGQSLLISAPSRAYSGEEDDGRRWGVFLPLYSLRSGRSWGAGDFRDLNELAHWAGRMGGALVGTLPLLASFLDEPFEPSPYVPMTHLFWNEFYIDVESVAEIETSGFAQDLLGSSGYRRELAELRAMELVDYRRQMAIKRNALELLARSFFEGPAERRWDAYANFLAVRPDVEDYARFRAAAEAQGKPWRLWPEEQRRGRLKPDDYEESVRQYYLYSQWLAHEQISAVSDGAPASKAVLYLDLPLGVHADGYDVWREKEVFATGVSAGAPPDSFFSEGQNWGFQPSRPEAMREQAYRYLIASLRHHLRCARALRIDHVMSLHRLYWVPEGMKASEGTYVCYPAEEMYAILCLESQRHQAIIVGEDLGTVPPRVRADMERHNLQRMYVVQFEIVVGEEALPSPPQSSVASAGTHDLPPFASFWRGLDIRDRKNRHLLDEEGFQREECSRGEMRSALTSFLFREGWLAQGDCDETQVLAGLLSFLSAGRSRLLMVNLEDLWLETAPQNLPGTGQQMPNWRRRARYDLEELSQLPEAVGILEEVDRLRRGRPIRSGRANYEGSR